MKTAVFFLFGLIVSYPALARDLAPHIQALELYPKSRASYQQKFDDRGEQYEIDARNYIDALYESHGEGGMKAGEPMLPETTLDAVLDNAGKQQAATDKAAGHDKGTLKNKLASKMPLPSMPQIPSLNTNTAQGK